MTYAIKLTTFHPDMGAEAVISAALQFPTELSHSTLVDIFAQNLAHKAGAFKSKRAAKAVADRINTRGSFGGFGKYAVIATVVSQ